MPIHWRIAMTLLLALGALSPALAADYRIPLMKAAPSLDGEIKPAEWAASAGFGGLMSANGMTQRRGQAFIGATESAIYVAVRTQLPEVGQLRAEVTTDTLQAMFDDAVEVFVTPQPGAEEIIYQYIGNSIGHGGYVATKLAGMTEIPDWKGNWRTASGIHDGYWHFECEIPLASMPAAKGRKITDGVWRINLCRDWQHPGQWSAIAPGRYLLSGASCVFTKEAAPGVQFSNEGNPFICEFKSTLSIANPSNAPLKVKATQKLTREGSDPQITPLDFTIAAGKSALMPVQYAPLKDKANPTGYTLQTLVTSTDGAVTYYDNTLTWNHDAKYAGWNADAADPMKRLLTIAPSPYEKDFGSRIPRTMSLLATSNAAHRNPVRILLYGQSITASAWWVMFEQELRHRFPYADITIENRAIGGFTAPALVRTAAHDLYPYYADLVIFHVYDGAAAEDYERIISNLRRYTTSEIMVRTAHLSNFDSPDIPLGQGPIYIADDLNADNLRYICQKYGCELEDTREEWKTYLKDNNLKPVALLSDGIHLNEDGQALLATLVMRHFRFNPVAPGAWVDTVRSYEAKRLLTEGAADEITFSGAPWRQEGNSVVGTDKNSALKLTFTGNKVDVIAGFLTDPAAKMGTARVLIDGKAPSSFPGCYAITRPSTLIGAWFPTVMRVGHEKPLVPEEWTFRVTATANDDRDITYEVRGSVTGPDGVGTNKERFVSKSGRVVIEPIDLQFLPRTKTYYGKPLPVGFEATWKVVPLCIDTYIPPAIPDRSYTRLITLAQGLDNTTHTLEIIPNGDGPVPVLGIQGYRPSLR